jgi:hypothetical protein
MSHQPLEWTELKKLPSSMVKHFSDGNMTLLRICFAKDPTEPASKFVVIITDDDGTMHMSISHQRCIEIDQEWVPGRYPTWDEIADARYALMPPEKYFAQILPPKEQYVAVHPTTFHLFETTDEKLVALCSDSN